jgi:hypothetical protein
MLTGDMPSRHLMRPVQSAGRRRQGRLADDAEFFLFQPYF